MDSSNSGLNTREALKERLAFILKPSLADIVSSTNSVRSRLRRAKVIYFLIPIGVFLVAMRLDDLQYDLYAGITGLLFFVLAIALTKRYLDMKNTFRHMLDEAVFPVLKSTFPNLESYSDESKNQEKVRTLINASGLFPDNDYEPITYNSYRFTGSSVFAVYQIEVKKLIRSGKGNRKELTPVFSGVFVTAELPPKQNGKIYISAVNTAHIDKLQLLGDWNPLPLNNTETETSLGSWKEFATGMYTCFTDPNEAQSLLTVEFLNHLHTWWLLEKMNVRMSIQGNLFYALLPYNSMKLYDVPSGDSYDAFENYLMTEVEPLSRAQLLIDKISN